MKAARAGLVGLALACVLAGAPATGRADVVELTSGYRIQGTVKEATSAWVMIVVGGREIRIRQERVRSIAFDAGKPPARPAPPPVIPPLPPLPAALATALTALGRLQAATTRPLGSSDYAALVDEVRGEVERSLGDPASHQPEVRTAIGSAIRYHAFAAFAGAVYEARGDLASVGRDPVIAECPALAELTRREAGRLGFDPKDPVVVGLIAASEGASALRACASEKLTEAETRARAGR